MSDSIWNRIHNPAIYSAGTQQILENRFKPDQAKMLKTHLRYYTEFLSDPTGDQIPGQPDELAEPPGNRILVALEVLPKLLAGHLGQTESPGRGITWNRTGDIIVKQKLKHWGSGTPESDDLVLLAKPASWSTARSARWYALAVAALWVLYMYILKTNRLIFLIGYRFSPRSTLQSAVNGASSAPVLLLGLPESHERTLKAELGFVPPEIDLGRLPAGGQERTLTALRLKLARIAHPAAASYVALLNLDTALRTPAARTAALELLEALLGGSAACFPAHRLIATATVNPLLHFDELFGSADAGAALTDIEKQRWHGVLSRFQAAGDGESAANEPETGSTPALRALWTECRTLEPLREIYHELAAALQETADVGEARSRLRERTASYYRLLYSSRARHERLLLVQLAASGFVNPARKTVLLELERLGLVVTCPRPQIFNQSFAEFLRSAEAPETVEKWEKESGESLWSPIRNVLVLALLAVAAVQLGNGDKTLETM
ncbi:MAG: hypothetical protein FJW37_15670, partial [Acidobacteria bacterium]|nr:hypothetical protein [Acidobacteriota bacterium]